jgi:hypothetical protein
MSRRNPVPWILSSLFFIAAIALLVIALLPFATMKSVLDVLSKDGNLSLLRPDDAPIFRFFIGFLSVCLFVTAYLTSRRQWKVIFVYIRQVAQDFRRLFSFSKPSRKELGFWGAVLIVTILGVIQRLVWIQGPMGHDEAYSIVTFADTVFHALTDYSLPNNHIFHTILVSLSIKLFGLSPWVTRLPAFAAGVLMIPGVYYLAKRIYDPWTGLLASLLVVFSNVLIVYSTTARGYTLVALFTLAILILSEYVQRENNLAAWGLISILSALGLFTVPIMLFPFGISFLWLFLEKFVTDPAPYASKWKFLQYWLISGILAALLTLAFYTPVLIYTGPQLLFANSFVAPLAWKDLPSTWHARLLETWVEWTVGVPLVLAVTLGAGWILGLAFHRRLSTIRIPLQLASLSWIAALLLIQRVNPWAKIWVFLLPLMLIWSAAGLVGLVRNIRLKFLYNISLAGIVTGMALLAGVWSGIQLIPRLPGLLAQRGDMENIVIYLKQNMNDTDLIEVDWPDDSPAWFYGLEYGISSFQFDKRIPYTRAWIIVNPPDGQTYESVIANHNTDNPPLNISAIKLVQTIGTHQIYECPAQ